MAISRKTLLTVAVVCGSLVASFDAATACGRRGGSSRGVSYGGYSRVSSYSHYARPSYSHVQPQVISPVQPVQQLAPTPGVAPVQPVNPELAQPQVAPQQPIAPGQPQQPQVAPQTQPAGVQNPTTIPQQQPLQPVSAPTQTVNPQQQAPAQAAPQQAAPQAPANAQVSALQALGGFAPPAATPQQAAPQTPAAPEVQTPVYVGNWTASLGNGAKVTLTLNADNTFSWSATNGSGVASTFSGSYSVADGSLTLNRSNDNQSLAGQMTQNDSNAFSFKVAGNNAAAISFARS